MIIDKPKILIIGHARHGKDTVAMMIADILKLKFSSSSHFVAKEILWKQWGIDRYSSFQEMFEDRVNHRALWADMISAYNTPDKTRTARTMLERGNDMYIGMRRRDELEACVKAKLFTHIVWVDAHMRHPPEHSSSMELNELDATNVIFNNSSLGTLFKDVKLLCNFIKESNHRQLELF